MEDRRWQLIIPKWPVQTRINAFFTTRVGGFSHAPWNSFNLGDHVNDNAIHVQKNRTLLKKLINQYEGTYPQKLYSDCKAAIDPVFLQQVHGIRTANLNNVEHRSLPADAAVCSQADWACTIMVADCLPILFAHQRLPLVAAAHAGWRGLLGQVNHGVIESCFLDFAKTAQTLLAHQMLLSKASLNLRSIAAETLVWLGPCIGPQAFEVGEEVYQSFLSSALGNASVKQEIQTCFQTQDRSTGHRRWLADIAGLARLRLNQVGISCIYGNNSTQPWCTYSNPDHFFSYRRDVKKFGGCGRMAACIWLSPEFAV